MHDLYDWLSRQTQGISTFHLFRIKLVSRGEREPGNAALYALLSRLAGRYIETIDERPIPVAIADRAHQRLLNLLASLKHCASADDQLVNLNQFAAMDLLSPTSEMDSVGETAKSISQTANKV